MTLGLLKKNNFGFSLRHYFVRDLRSAGIILFSAISRKVVAKKVHATIVSRKVIWNMIITLYLTTVAVEPTFVAFL